MIKFRNVSGDPRDVASGRGQIFVDKDQVIEVGGEVVEETDEAYTVLNPDGNPERVDWQKSLWHLVGGATKRDDETGRPLERTPTGEATGDDTES